MSKKITADKLDQAIEQVLLDNILLVGDDEQTYMGTPNELIYALKQAIEAYIAEQLQQYAEWSGEWPEGAKENVALFLAEPDHLSKKGTE